MERFEKFSPEQRREIWDRVAAGESVKSIARSFHRYIPARCVSCSSAPVGSVHRIERAHRGA